MTNPEDGDAGPDQPRGGPPQGGRWDVSTKSDAVYLERRSEDDEGLFEARLAPEEARELAALLTKYADKAESSDEDDSSDKDDSGEEDSDEDADD